jgi:hypothetical protein
VKGYAVWKSTKAMNVSNPQTQIIIYQHTTGYTHKIYILQIESIVYMCVFSHGMGWKLNHILESKASQIQKVEFFISYIFLIYTAMKLKINNVKVKRTTVEKFRNIFSKS